MATEKRLIDAIALISKARRMETTDNNGIPVDTFAVPVMAIEDAPTVDAVEVVHGRWEKAEDFDFISGEYVTTGFNCDKCGCYYKKKSNYCPNCGADMREKE